MRPSSEGWMHDIAEVKAQIAQFSSPITVQDAVPLAEVNRKMLYLLFNPPAHTPTEIRLGMVDVWADIGLASYDALIHVLKQLLPTKEGQ